MKSVTKCVIAKTLKEVWIRWILNSMKLQQLEISLKLNNLNSVTLGYPKAKHVEFPTDSVLNFYISIREQTHKKRIWN